MKMILCGLKIKEKYHVLVNQFHGNFRSKNLYCRKIKCVFRDVKWCFNASWGLKGLNEDCKCVRDIINQTTFTYISQNDKHWIYFLIFNSIQFGPRTVRVKLCISLSDDHLLEIARARAARHSTVMRAMGWRGGQGVVKNTPSRVTRAYTPHRKLLSSRAHYLNRYTKAYQAAAMAGRAGWSAGRRWRAGERDDARAINWLKLSIIDPNTRKTREASTNVLWKYKITFEEKSWNILQQFKCSV